MCAGCELDVCWMCAGCVPYECYMCYMCAYEWYMCVYMSICAYDDITCYNVSLSIACASQIIFGKISQLEMLFRCCRGCFVRSRFVSPSVILPRERTIL